MKRFREGFLAVVMVVGFMGFILGYDFSTPIKANAEEKAVKAEKETKPAAEKKAATETKTAKPAAAPAKKKAVKKGSPVLTVTQQVIEVGKTVAVDIIGTGFQPDQEVRILYTDADGMQTDIGYALSPQPQANKSGAFFTTWDGTQFIKAKLVRPGAFTLTATTSEFKPLAETNVFFKAAPKAAKKAEPKKEGGEKKKKKEE